MPLFLSATLILRAEDEIYSLENDFSTVHQFLGRLHDKALRGDDKDIQPLILDTIILYKQFNPTEEQLSDFFGEFSCVTRFQRDIIDGEFRNVESMVSAQEEENRIQLAENVAQKMMARAPEKSSGVSRWVFRQALSCVAASIVISVLLEYF
jgi:hypothetical protein